MSEPRILVVDDTPANVRLLAATLGPHGYAVTGASGGVDALAAIAAGGVDLVLLDIQMPGMNGYEVCRRVRADLRLPALPIVMVTASQGEERSLALEAGADDFVVRPFDQAELLARVRSLLRIKEYHDRLEAQALDLRLLNEALEERVATQVAELEQLQELRRFLPGHLAVALQARGEEVLGPHRQEVAVLRCRLDGLAGVIAGAEPEEGVAALRDFHQVLGGLVAACGATVGSLTGDAVTLFFNDPLPCDAPVARAVDLALAIRDAMEPVAEGWRRRGHDLAVASGVSFGYATLGIIGFEGRFDYGAVGAVVDAAHRLGRLAGPGDVLLTRAAFAAVDGVVDCRPAPSSDGDASVWSVLATSTGPVAAPIVDVRILGPLEVAVRGRAVALTAAKERALLCLLAMRAGTVVAPERLADELWEGSPPDSALTTLRAHVSRLRKALAAAGAPGILVTRPTGYLLEVDPDELDVGRFLRGLDEGRAALEAGAVGDASEHLAAALGEWRGAALQDIADTLAAGAEATRLEELRLVASEDHMEAELRGGRHREVLTELEALTTAHPLRERFWAQRMLALHRSGRQPEALRAYQRLRTVLAEEVGLEPSPELARLESAIARRDASLDLDRLEA